MSFDIEFPLDSDGFLRRACPHCGSQFKWHGGPANAEAESQDAVELYHCPLCGQPADLESWDTQAQSALIDGAIEGYVGGSLNDIVDDMFRGLKSSKFIKVESTGRFDEPDPPAPLTEPDDMTIVVSPCHGWEPVKVPDHHTGPLYCLICGLAFAV